MKLQNYFTQAIVNIIAYFSPANARLIDLDNTFNNIFIAAEK